MPDVPAERIDALSAAIHGLINGRKVEPVQLPAEHPDDEIRQLTGFVNTFIKEYDELGEFMQAVAKGDLEYQPPRSKLKLMGHFKSLAANLRQLTWAAQRIAAGDFSQRIDFMGDFSVAFNKMAGDLGASFTRIASQNEELAREIDERTLVEAELRRGEARIQAVLDAGINAASGMNVLGQCLVVTLPDGLSDAAFALVRDQATRLVAASGVRGVIFDVSAVRLLDTRVFEQLTEMAKAMLLIGAKTVFTGFQAGVVSALMDLDVDFSGIQGAVDMADAFTRLGLTPPGLAASDERDDGEAQPADGEEDGDD